MCAYIQQDTYNNIAQPSFLFLQKNYSLYDRMTFKKGNGCGSPTSIWSTHYNERGLAVVSLIIQQFFFFSSSNKFTGWIKLSLFFSSLPLIIFNFFFLFFCIYRETFTFTFMPCHAVEHIETFFNFSFSGNRCNHRLCWPWSFLLIKPRTVLH